MRSDPLPWLEPRALAVVLAERFGRDGLVLLDGDGSPLGCRGVLGVDPVATVSCRGLPGDPGAADPFDVLADLERQGGPWLGWLGYEAGAWVEPAEHWQASDMATLWAARHDPLIHFDRGEGRLWLEGQDPDRFAAMVRLLQDPATGAAVAGAGERPADGPGIARDAWHWHTPPDTYAAQVGILREWIAAGDLFQANLTACCESLRPEPPDPLALYGRLVSHGPAPFAGLAVAGGEAVISASPERFLRLHPNGQVETRPIKGTRPRRADPDADAASAAELICDPKDRAENVMIVDLLRNDLGRVCVPGSVHVPQLLGLESYAHVHHLTSVVMGRLADGRGLVDLLRACWPGGSITGAPKVRACQRLNQLEPVPRGPYCGSLFHLGADGSFDSSILIRTLLQKGRRLRLHAGGGIVADSDPAGEAREMGWKIEPLLEALA
ncbi:MULTISPECIES: anthranilate synthase component I family protein [unclassified Synechococcus]|uniref:anthranilate synthase component I family protein n=1 Tax=unclassified Synechococcus TaxID=2626047 RepID=UPI000B98F12E|nr:MULTISPECIES: anthranilate synthase component I family protein [unclassified Synechococcus]